MQGPPGCLWSHESDIPEAYVLRHVGMECEALDAIRAAPPPQSATSL